MANVQAVTGWFGFSCAAPDATAFASSPLQELAGSEWETAIRHHLDVELTSSLIVYKNGELWARSSAVLAIFSELGWLWSWMLLLWLVPRRVRDALYDAYATRRYQLAGKARDGDVCERLPVQQQALVLREAPPADCLFPPRPRVFLSAQWRNLILVNYAVPAETLKPYLPWGVELDEWNGQMLMSLVCFSFAGTSFGGTTAPLCADFEEVNLRFYVKRPHSGGLRRGVVFIRELVPFSTVAQVANLLFGEQYRATHMNSRMTPGTTLEYSWGVRDSRCRVTAQLGGAPKPFAPGSLDEFITEHYWGYAPRGENASTEYEVEHPSWRTWSDAKIDIHGDIARHYPAAFGLCLTEPHSTLVAEGSPVRVLKGSPTTVA